MFAWSQLIATGWASKVWNLLRRSLALFPGMRDAFASLGNLAYAVSTDREASEFSTCSTWTDAYVTRGDHCFSTHNSPGQTEVLRQWENWRMADSVGLCGRAG